MDAILKSYAQCATAFSDKKKNLYDFYIFLAVGRFNLVKFFFSMLKFRNENVRDGKAKEKSLREVIKCALSYMCVGV